MSDWVETAGVAVQALTFAATGAAALAVYAQASRHFRLDRTQKFIERFNSEFYFNIRHNSELFCSAPIDFDALFVRARYGSEPDLLTRRITLAAYANLFQEIGGALRRRTIDPVYTWQVFGGLTVLSWKVLAPFVDSARRAFNRPTLFEDFEYLFHRMRAIDRARSGIESLLERDLHTRRAASSPRRELVYIFGYGSLMSPASATRSIRPWHPPGDPITAPIDAIDPMDLWRCELRGYRRQWGVPGYVRLASTGEEVRAAFLGLRPLAEGRCNGVLVAVGRDHIRTLCERERGYTLIEVTDAIEPRPFLDLRIFTFVGRDLMADGDGIVLEEYESIVRSAARALGTEFADRFEETTDPTSRHRRQGAYEFVDRTQQASMTTETLT